ncbi:MAG TPA: hypothetical protein VK447_14260 [Myxococcaceae bacterium]|nr:hypothetical protein [Myxococcaceae bacterium]
MTDRKVATLTKELACFGQPDTRLAALGQLPQQHPFNVLDERRGFPSEDTDYLLLSTPGVGTGQAWVCSRWKDQRYASVMVEDGMTIAESHLVARLKDFKGYGYELADTNISYPWPLPGINVRTGAPNPKINCCTFVEALLVKSWEDALPGRIKWNASRHDQMMIRGTDLYSPVTAVVEAGIATPIADTNAPPPPWTIIQGWKNPQQPKEGGHSFLVVAQRNGAVLTLEANAAHGLSGVGFRGLGNAEQFGFAPPPGWWQNAALWKEGKVWTWQRILGAYAGIKMARLKVSNLRWAV